MSMHENTSVKQTLTKTGSIKINKITDYHLIIWALTRENLYLVICKQQRRRLNSLISAFVFRLFERNHM